MRSGSGALARASFSVRRETGEWAKERERGPLPEGRGYQADPLGRSVSTHGVCCVTSRKSMTHLRLLLFHLLFLPPPSTVAAPMHRDCTRDQNACIRTPRKRSSPNFLARNRATTTTTTDLSNHLSIIFDIRHIPAFFPLAICRYSTSFQIIPSAIKIYIYIFDDHFSQIS